MPLGSGAIWGVRFSRRITGANESGPHLRALLAYVLAFHWAKEVTGPGPKSIRQRSSSAPTPPLTRPWEGKGSGCLLNSDPNDRAFLPMEAGTELLVLVFYCCCDKLSQAEIKQHKCII